MNSRITLVFGGDGQVGGALARLGPSLGWDVRSFGHAAGDIADRVVVDQLIAAHHPAVVINAAAYTKVDAAESEAGEAFRINAEGAEKVAEACRKSKIPLIHFSTDYIFDGQASRPYREEDSQAPLNVYGQSKAEGERLIRATLNEYVILRSSWIYAAQGRNFLLTMLRLGSERSELGVVDDQVGCPTYADDIARAALDVAANVIEGRGFGVYNCCNGGETSWFNFARSIFAEASRYGGPAPNVKPITTEQYPLPARRPAYSVLDCKKLADTHNVHMRNWHDAMADCIAEIYKGKLKQ
jgi:dTDP-4-dehydrorhamnose reductase